MKTFKLIMKLHSAVIALGVSAAAAVSFSLLKVEKAICYKIEVDGRFQRECKQKSHIVRSPIDISLRIRSIRDKTLCHVKNREQIYTLRKDGAWAYFNRDWTFIRTNSGCEGMIQHKYLRPVK